MHQMYKEIIFKEMNQDKDNSLHKTNNNLNNNIIKIILKIRFNQDNFNALPVVFEAIEIP